MRDRRIRSGVRFGSALAIDVGDLDFQHGEIHLRTTKNDRPTTAVLPAGVAKRLKAFVEDRGGGVPGRGSPGLDAARPAAVHLCLFKPAQLAAIHAYVERAERCFRVLLKRVLAAVAEDGEVIATHEPAPVDGETLLTVERLMEAMKGVMQ